jgi:hypothetical protein
MNCGRVRQRRALDDEVLPEAVSQQNKVRLLLATSVAFGPTDAGFGHPVVTDGRLRRNDCQGLTLHLRADYCNTDRFFIPIHPA